MSIPLANFPARLLPRAAALTLASILAACGGGGGGGGGEYHPPPPPPEPTYTTYDVIPLTLPGSAAGGIVRNTAITADGKVAGALDMQDGGRHAFVYDGVKMIDLGTMGGTRSEATGLNQSGQVVGWVAHANYLRGFVYDGTMHELGTFGGDDSAAYGINERGQVTGFATTYNGVRHAFLYVDGKMGPVRNDGVFSAGWSINAGGAVAGDYRLGDDGALHAFLSGACGCAHDLGTLGGAESLAYGLNDMGEVIGTSDTADAQRHAFVVREGLMKDLGTFGGAGSFAAAINQAGQIAGYADDKSGNSVAFLHDSKGLRELGSLGGAVSRAAALNATGQVVGFAATAKGDNHAFLWTVQDGMVDLNTRLRGAPAGLVLTGGAAIADNGSIVAYANTGLVLLKIHPRP